MPTAGPFVGELEGDVVGGVVVPIGPFDGDVEGDDVGGEVSAGIVGPFVCDIEGAVDGDFDGADVG